MSTQTAAPTTEVERLHRFLGQQIAAGHTDLTVAQALESFQAYQRAVEKLREELRPAIEEVARGEYRTIDRDELKARVRWRLAVAGITDANATANVADNVDAVETGGEGADCG